MSIFKRLFKMGEAEVNSALDKLEDPIKLTEQGIRDLKKDLDQSLKGLAELKAVAIRTKRDRDEAANKSKSYENKAMLLLKKAQDGGISPEEADRLATEALNLKGQADETVASLSGQVTTHDTAVAQMEGNVNKLKSQIAKWENELKTLKARHKVSQTTAKINKQMANVDSSSTVSMLEKMKDKVAEQEALAESYGEMADMNQSVDSEIDKALGTPAPGNDALAALKAKMNMQ